MNIPPTMAAALDSISNSTVIPKPSGSPAFSSNMAKNPGV